MATLRPSSLGWKGVVLGSLRHLPDDDWGRTSHNVQGSPGNMVDVCI